MLHSYFNSEFFWWKTAKVEGTAQFLIYLFQVCELQLWPVLWLLFWSPAGWKDERILQKADCSTRKQELHVMSKQRQKTKFSLLTCNKINRIHDLNVSGPLLYMHHLGTSCNLKIYLLLNADVKIFRVLMVQHFKICMSLYGILQNNLF